MPPLTPNAIVLTHLQLREGAQTLQNKTGNVESRELAATRREESLDRRQESLAAREQDLTTKNAETSARENTLAATSRQTLDAQMYALLALLLRSTALTLH